VTTCRSCDAEVVFVPSAKTGKPMILDAKPAKGVVLIDGTVPVAQWDKVILVGFGPELDDDRTVAAVVDVYTDHHATCPNAGEWKGRTRATAPA
jgi:hypothetical protein